MGYTKEPWKVNRIGKRLYVEGGTDETGLCAEIQTWGDDVSETDLANAQLISLSPEMIEVLKTIIFQYSNNGNIANDTLQKANELTKKTRG